jgi:STAS domain
MPDQDTRARPVIVTLPGQITTVNAERAAGQMSAAFTPGVSVVVADLTCTACRDRSAIRYLLRAHRTAAARGRQVRFAIRPGASLHRITDFAGTHPLLAVYPTLQHAITGESPAPPRRPRPPPRHRHL